MNQTKDLVDAIVSSIQEKKGEDITIVDLSRIDGAIANSFVICQGNSPTQVEAIAGSVSDMVREQLHEKPCNVIGLGNDQWVAIDYTDVIVHIFQPEIRCFYDLENLWEDANLTHVPNQD
ncbi:ribosome silencing factor [Prevotella sp. A2931]|uniref:Ribosomal silencing factor RsfS n=1 Tax=Prevotella illustrans TaxID=2800387 RepID=A0ABS3M611_9BACT|nr:MULTISPECIES: ribosome silencing factor [Prevotella]MBO1363613.1 ribosome silencing factor [Prevotella illustrans]PTL27199.1 ribosome silencing factor [Prevotella sp. oral taxon 820]